MKIRTSDSIILYPAPLIVPGASRFNQLLAITSDLHDLAEKEAQDPHTKTHLLECLQLLKKFMAEDSHHTSKAPSVPDTASTRHRPSSDTGLDLLGWKFKEQTLGTCTSTDTLLDDNNILWNTLQIASSKTDDTFVAKVSEVRKWIRRDKTALSPPVKTDPLVPTIVSDNLPPELRHPIEENSPFRSILLPPRSIPPPRLRLPAKSTRDERR
jgi:hypothetical protein